MSQAPLIFQAGKKRSGYYDVHDFFIWDMNRDTDGGKWRESYRASPLTVNEGVRSYVRSDMPSTVVLISRTGIIEIHDFTRVVAAKYEQETSLIETISGPIPVDAECRVSAGEGMIAVSTGTKLFLFDMVSRQIFMVDETGLYLVKGPPMIVGPWESYQTILIGDGYDSGITTLGAVSVSRANEVYGERGKGRGKRPFVFVEADDRIVGVRPDLKIIEFFDSGWGYTNGLKCLPDGTLIFQGGADDENFFTYLIRPASWYYSLGTGQVDTHAYYVSGDDVTLTGGNDEVGIEDESTGHLVVQDVTPSMGGCRVFHTKGLSPKVPGSISFSLLCKDDPESNPVMSGLPGALTGTLTTTDIRGFNFFSGWSTGNWMEVTEVPMGWMSSWAISLLVFGEVNAGIEHIFEYGHAPAGYTGSAARLITDDGIIKFQTTNDGWSTVDTEIEFGEISEKPMVIMCGAYSAETASMSFASVDGIIKFDKGSAPTYNASALLSIGRARDGSNPCDSHSISSVTCGLNFGYTAVMKCLYENLEMISQYYSATELHGHRHYLAGGDDEFDVYGVITDTNLTTVRDGLLTSVPLDQLGFIGTTLVKADMRGWRVGIMFDDDTLLDRGLWLAPGTLSFSRSDFESIITGPGVKGRTFSFDTMLGSAEDHIGPLLPVSPGEDGVFKITAKRRDLFDGVTLHIEGTVTVQRDNTGAALATIIADFGSATEITATAHAQGAYLSLEAAPTDGKQEWNVEIIRL